jgi:hypothetical protein
VGSNADMKLQLVIEAVNRFQATFDQLKNDLGQTSSSLETVSASGTKSNENVSILTGSLGGLQKAIMGVVAGLISWKSAEAAIDTIMFAANVEQATRAMDVIANSTGRSASELEKWRDKIRDMNITTMAATGAVTQFARAQLPLEKLPMLASMAQGAAIMSTMTGRTLSSSEAFETMIRALITGQTVELHQLGLDVSRIEAMRQMREETGLGSAAYSQHGMRLEELSMLIDNNKNITDLYTKSQDLATKQIQSSKRPIEEMKLALGQLFLPELTEGATWFYKTVRDGMEYFRSSDGKSALREWKLNILESLYAVRAEIMKMAMDLDKIGMAGTSAAMLLYGPGKALGSQHETKMFDSMAAANMEYSQRIQEGEAGLKRMYDQIQALKEAPPAGKQYQDDPALIAKGLTDRKALAEKEAEARRLAAEQAAIEAQREADAYTQTKRQAHEAYMAYAKAFDDRILAQIKESNAMQLAELDDRHSRGLISEQTYLNDRLVLEKAGINAELQQLETGLVKAKAARDAAAAANKVVGHTAAGKPLYNAEDLATENKTDTDYQNLLKQREALQAKVAQAGQKYSFDSIRATLDQVESVEKLNVELLKLEGNEKAAVNPQIWLDYHKQLDAAVNGMLTAATPEEEAQYQTMIAYLTAIIGKKTEIAEIDARSKIAQRDELEIAHFLADIDDKEKLRQLETLDAMRQRKSLMEESLALQEANLGQIDKGSDYDAWIAQQGKVDAARQKLRDHELEMRAVSDDMAAGLSAGFKSYVLQVGGGFKQMETLAKDTAQAMQQSFSDFFFDAMQGKMKNFGDYTRAFLGSIERAIANVMAQKLTSSIVGFDFAKLFGARAEGGPVTSGKPYIVGEKGMELFIPQGSGTIIPNHALSSANPMPVGSSGGGQYNISVPVTVNGGGEGGGQALGREHASALAGALRNAVQMELLNQRRPGGILNP